MLISSNSADQLPTTYYGYWVIMENADVLVIWHQGISSYYADQLLGVSSCLRVK